MQALAKFFEQKWCDGYTAQQALSAGTVEGFVIQARNYVELISDRSTFAAYLEFLQWIAEGQLRKVRRRVRTLNQPEGMADEMWRYLIDQNPNLGEEVLDPLGAEIAWLEAELQQQIGIWEGKAHGRAADL